MTTSIMLTTFNRLDLTKRMMKSLFSTTHSPYRLIIIDNGSSDETPDFLENLKKDLPKECVGYEYALNEKNQGIAIGRNMGLQIADKYNDEWLSTVDNDVEFPDNWLDQCLDIMKANKRLSIGVNFEPTNYPLTTWNGKTFQLKDKGNLGTACTVFPRDLHTKIGFFKMNDFLYSHEDADFFQRARMVGYQMGYLKENGLHFGEGELDKGEYREFKNEQAKNNLPYYYKDCADYMSGKKSIYIAYP